MDLFSASVLLKTFYLLTAIADPCGSFPTHQGTAAACHCTLQLIGVFILKPDRTLCWS